MKSARRQLLITAGAALLLTLAFPAGAQPPAAPESAPAADPTRPGGAASARERRTPEPPLRRIDQPDTVPSPAPAPAAPSRHGGSEFPLGDHRIAAERRVHEVVSILGSNTVEGEVTTDAVSVLGHTTIGPRARVGGAAVAVLGRLDVQGYVDDEAVSVLGGVNINGHVNGEAVSVLGPMRLGPNAVVNGDVVVVLGSLSKHPDAVIRGNQVSVPGLGWWGGTEWLDAWFKRGVLLGRPLAFGEHLGWAWMVALSFLALYLVLALLFPRAVECCANTLETRPGYSILASLLTVFLTPIAIVLLLFTIVGALLVPFLLVVLIFASLFGKAVMLAWLGRRVLAAFGSPAAHVALAVFVGGIIVLALYLVPFLGFLVFKLLGWLGLGVVIYTIGIKMNAEKAAAPPMTTGLPAAPGSAIPPAAASTAGAPATAAMSAPAEPAIGSSAETTSVLPARGEGPEPAPSAGFAPPHPPPPVAGAPSAPTPPPALMLPPGSALALPRASLWIRLAALLLDVILVALILAFLSELLPRGLHFRSGPPGMLPILALYGALMWKMKGTTIGGIVCGLKVVRIDGREVDWPTAVVRALACFLSLIVVGLGFIWIAIDDEKQSWHDKIAGTIVVRMPKGMSLI